MATKFDYPMFPEVDKDHWCHVDKFPYYRNTETVSLLNLNGKKTIKEQWDKLDDDEKWQEFICSMQVVVDLYVEVKDLKDEVATLSPSEPITN